MHYTPSIIGRLIAPIDRGRFDKIVERHDGDAYDKSFTSWDHLLALIYAQLGGATSLRSLQSGWNAHSQHHYHLGSGELRRSTLSDAGQRRPLAVFTETFELLVGLLDRQVRRDGKAMLRLIDSTPIPLGKLCDWAKSNGRIRGMKMHIVYDPNADCPRILGITDATVNDAQIGRTISIEKGATYVFDKGYCHYGWWTAIAKAKAVFVTRPKSNMRLEVKTCHLLDKVAGDGFTVLGDDSVSLASKGDSSLDIPLRRISVQRQEGETFMLLTNDIERPAVEIAALYKARWQIELLFRWIKQHLKIRKFMAKNDNAIRLQLVAAMIAYVLLRIAANAYRVSMPILRFTELVGRCLFDRRHIDKIDRPPPVNPSHRTPPSPNQMAFSFK